MARGSTSVEQVRPCVDCSDAKGACAGQAERCERDRAPTKHTLVCRAVAAPTDDKDNGSNRQGNERGQTERAERADAGEQLSDTRSKDDAPPVPRGDIGGVGSSVPGHRKQHDCDADSDRPWVTRECRGGDSSKGEHPWWSGACTRRPECTQRDDDNEVEGKRPGG